jgi:phosphate/sulfate permease
MADKKIISVRPSPLASMAGVVGGVIGMGIGIAFLAAVPSEPGPDGFFAVFFMVWFLVCAGMIAYSLYNLASFKKGQTAGVPLTATDVVEMEQDEEQAMDFAERLRKLDALHRDGLISEEEFLAKRRQILEEKW